MEQKQLGALAWALGLWGTFSVVIGSLVLIWPGITLKVLLILMGINFVVTGAVITIGSLVDRKGHWVTGIIMGILSLIAGMYVFANPGISALVLLYVIAVWAIVVGALQIAGGFESQEDKGWLIFSGIVSVLFGLYIFGRPLSGALAVIWIIGLATITQGVLLVIAAFKTSSVSKLETSTARRR